MSCKARFVKLPSLTSVPRLTASNEFSLVLSKSPLTSLLIYIFIILKVIKLGISETFNL